MNINNFLDFFKNFSPWIIVKIILLILLLFYLFFAAILNRQITLMNKVLEAKFSPVIKLIAIIQLLFVVFLFISALIFL